MVSVGLKPLIDGKVETEKRKRYRFRHNASKVKRGRRKNHSEEDVNEAAIRTAAHSILLCSICCSLSFDAAIRTANKMRCGAPGVVRQRLETSNCISASDRLARGQ